jgi:histidyl-tRNA synthetase
MVAVWPNAAEDALRFAAELRAAGLRVDVYPDSSTKLGTQISYASRRNIPFVVFIGEDERDKGLVGLKNLKSGKQETLQRGEVAAVVKVEVGHVE